jgi:tRNA G37 N-methylase TrmD
MWIGVVSIFPNMFGALTGEGVVARAITPRIVMRRSTIGPTAVVPVW